MFTCTQLLKKIHLKEICSQCTVVDLAKALNPEAMLPILANPEVQQRLIPYLPEGESLPKTEEELRNTVSSPQFQQVKAFIMKT